MLLSLNVDQTISPNHIGYEYLSKIVLSKIVDIVIIPFQGERAVSTRYVSPEDEVVEYAQSHIGMATHPFWGQADLKSESNLTSL